MSVVNIADVCDDKMGLTEPETLAQQFIALGLGRDIEVNERITCFGF